MNQSIFNQLPRSFCYTLTQTVGRQREVPTAASDSGSRLVSASRAMILAETSDTGSQIYQCYRSGTDPRSQYSLDFVSRCHAGPNEGIQQPFTAASFIAPEPGVSSTLSSKDCGGVFMANVCSFSSLAFLSFFTFCFQTSHFHPPWSCTGCSLLNSLNVFFPPAVRS